MRRTVFVAIGAAALLSTAAFAQEPAQEQDSTRVAAADSAAAFTKLDTDADGRISAIEAASESKVAQGFTTADADKDGYLSKAEFARLSLSIERGSPSSAQPRSQEATPDPSMPAPKP
jgi:EF hand